MASALVATVVCEPREVLALGCDVDEARRHSLSVRPREFPGRPSHTLGFHGHHWMQQLW